MRGVRLLFDACLLLLARPSLDVGDMVDDALCSDKVEVNV